MTVVAPCITVETPEEFQAAVAKLQPFAERVHVDVSDGEFAPRKLLDPSQLSWPADWIVDIHAMVKRPREYVQALVALRPYTICLHAEADEDIVPLLQYIKDNGVRAGVSLLKTTVPSTVAEAIKVADYVMIFSGDLGHYGGKASILQLHKIPMIKSINPSVEIAWDGGVSPLNASLLTIGGVDVLNSGGSINNAPDPQAAYNQIVTAVQQANSHNTMFAG